MPWTWRIQAMPSGSSPQLAAMVLRLALTSAGIVTDSLAKIQGRVRRAADAPVPVGNAVADAGAEQAHFRKSGTSSSSSSSNTTDLRRVPEPFGLALPASAAPLR